MGDPQAMVSFARCPLERFKRYRRRALHPLRARLIPPPPRRNKLPLCQVQRRSRGVCVDAPARQAYTRSPPHLSALHLQTRWSTWKVRGPYPNRACHRRRDIWSNDCTYVLRCPYLSPRPPSQPGREARHGASNRLPQPYQKPEPCPAKMASRHCPCHLSEQA